VANGVELATAYISLSVETGKVKDQIKGAFNGVSGKAVGQKLGQEMADSIRNRMSNMPWIRSSLQNATNGAGTTAGRRYSDEMKSALVKGGAAAGMATGKAIGAGITAGIGVMNIGTAIFAPIERAGKAAAVRIGAQMKAALSASLVGLGFGAGAMGIGYPLLGGLDRMKSIQAATVQLNAMKRTRPELDPMRIRQDMLSVVEGTPFSLQEAMGLVPGAIGADVKQGEELKRLVRLTGDATASTGGKANFDDISRIMQQVLSKGRLQGEELLQFSEWGVQLRPMLTRALGVDGMSLEKMMRDGKVTPAMVLDALEQNVGGMGLAMGNTYEGSIKNLQSNVKKMGAEFIAALTGTTTDAEDPLKGITTGVQRLTENLKNVTAWVRENKDEIRSTFLTVKDAVVSVSTAIKDTIKFLNEHRGLVIGVGSLYAGWKAVSVAAALADKLLKINGAMRLLGRTTRTARATKVVETATDAAAATAVAGGGGRSGGSKLGRLGGKALRAVPLVGTALVAYDLLQEIPAVREFTDKIPEMFGKVKDSITDAFRTGQVRQFLSNAKQGVSEFATSAAAVLKEKLGGVWDGISNKAKGIWNGVGTKIKSWIETAKTTVTNGFQTAWNTVSSAFDTVVTKVSGKLADWFGPESWIGKALSAVGLGMPAANAAAVPPSVPNTGPMAPGAFGNYRGRAGLAPGTRLDGSDQSITGVPGATAQPSASIGGVYMGDEALLSKIKAGRYVTPEEYETGDPNLGDLTQGLGDCTSAIQDLVALMDGQPTMGRTLPDGRSMYTGTAQEWAEANGFIRTDKPVPGAFQIGFFHNGAGAAGHMQATLPDGTNVNWGSDEYAANKGVGDAGAWDDPRFTHHYYRPVNRGDGTTYAPMSPEELTNPALTNPAPAAPPAGQTAADPSLLDRAQGWAAGQLADLLPRVLPRLGFATGGSVFGAGTATSDSIPAMLSNGEHVLTAKDVKKMGGQSGVYAFRSALQNGLIPGFTEGGGVYDIFSQPAPVDPNAAREQADRFRELSQNLAIAKQQQAEVAANAEATPLDRLGADRAVMEATRAQTQEMSAAAARAAGKPLPDFSIQNDLQDTAYGVAEARGRLEALNAADQSTIAESDRMAANWAVEEADRARFRAIEAAKTQDTNAGAEKPDFMKNLIRTGGFTPSGGGGKAGTSSLAGFINMGGEFVNGLIDTGASLVQSAATAAAAVGTAGAGAAAAPAAGAAASYGIQLGAATLKRGVSWGFEMAGIGADAVISQLFPFGGPPRWIGYDYAGMMPQLGIQQAALTTIEQYGQQAINGQKPPQPFSVPQVPGAAAPSPQGPVPPVPAPGPDQAGPGLDIETRGLPNPYGIGGWTNPLLPLRRAGGGHVGIYDQGGILEPGDIAVNKSRTPEAVLTPSQWKSMEAAAAQPAKGNDAPMVKIDAIYGMSPEDVADQIEQKQRLAVMQYGGRPY
jgi:tape measure domain-containing protein